MITDLLILAGSFFGGLFFETFPRFNELDGVIITANGWLGPMLDGAASLGVWIPWSTVATCGAVLVNVYVASLMFKLLRALWSYVPLFGGAG